MRSYRATVLLIISTFAAAVVTTAVASLQSQSSTSQANQQNLPQEDFESQYPTVDFAGAEAASPERHRNRQAKGKKYDDAGPPLRDRGNTKYVITGGFNWSNELSALPVDKSQVVLIGKVTDARAYLSNDRTGVYSEFTIHIEEVLKNDSPTPLEPGGTVAADRSGGRVQFPSGGVTLVQVPGQGIPRPGRRYVLFLTAGADAQDLTILTGYELKNGRVDLLDFQRGGAHPLARYKEMDVTTFLNDLKSAISNPAPKRN